MTVVRCTQVALTKAWSQQSIGNTWQRIEPLKFSENLKKDVLLQFTNENL